MTTDYILDADDQIVGVGNGWDTFALENAGHGAVFQAITGSSIWDHVLGDETKSFLNNLFFACRQASAPVSYEYRCDAPHLQRLIRQTIRPQPSNGLLIENRILREHSIASGPNVIRFVPRVEKKRCSRCCVVQIGDNYVDPFVLDEDIVEVGNYGICPVCRCTPRDLSSLNQPAKTASKHEALHDP